MNVMKMWRYTRKVSERGCLPVFCADSPFDEADWREFSAMGYVDLEPAGDDEFYAILTDKGLLLKRDRRARRLHAVGGFLVGIAATVIAQWIITFVSQ